MNDTSFTRQVEIQDAYKMGRLDMEYEVKMKIDMLQSRLSNYHKLLDDLITGDGLNATGLKIVNRYHGFEVD